MSSKAYFDQIAPDWERVRTAFFSTHVREKAYSVAGVRAGEVAADIGAGTGFIAEGLIERGLTVIAVDQSAGMLAELSKRLPGIDARLGSAEQLPIPTASLDHVFANMYLHHVEDPALAIREMARTVRTGGKVVITDLDQHDHEFLRVEQHDRWMGFDRADVRNWFVAAGLKNAVVDCVGAECRSDSDSGTEHANVSIFVAYGEK